MSLKKKVVFLVLLVLVLWILLFLFAQVPAFIHFYSASVYPGIQSGRGAVFNLLPFSFGDIMYLAGGLWLLLTVIRWIYYIRKLRVHRDRLAGSVLNTLNISLLAYIFFLAFWGGNYSKVPLAKTWGLNNSKKLPKEVSVKKRREELVAFNGFLTTQLKKYAPRYTPLPPHYINERAIAYYREYTDSKIKENGLNVKSTLFGFVIRRMGVDGYYNPFTGEGQANMDQPLFVMPFIICHEMAHQAGIAAEGDANLLAYALCTSVNDDAFRYSAYLNLWMYANRRLHHLDSTAAGSFEKALQEMTRKQIDTLADLYRKYQGVVSEYTSDMYDSYLRLQQQEGISSYGNVVNDAWALENRRLHTHKKTLIIP